MNTNFDFAVQHTLGLEGGFTVDTGGRTMYGITEEVWRRFGDVRIDVRNISKEQAIDVYRKQYWDILHLDAIHDKFIAAELFDTCVNCGPSQAALFAQMAYNYVCTDEIALQEDGKFGTISIAAFNEAVDKGRRHLLLLAMNGEQYIFYRNLVRNGTKYDSYARGWLKRIQLLED